MFFWVRVNTYRASTPVYPLEYPYECALCKATSTARVFSQGVGVASRLYGIGADSARASAQSDAEQALWRNAAHSLSHAACPSCHRFSPAVIESLEARGQHEPIFARWKKWVVIPAALAAVVGFGGAAYDGSGWLALAIVALLATIGALMFAYVARSMPRLQPLVHPRNVAFWWNESWYVPSVWYTSTSAPKVSYRPHMFASLAAGLFALAITVGVGVRWGGSFTHLHVLNTQPDHRPLRIVLDGKDLGVVDSYTRGKDYGTQTFGTRMGPHHVTAFDDSGAVVEEFDFTNGWHEDTVFTPAAVEHDVCVGLVTTVYGTRYSSDPPAGSDDFFANDIAQIDPPDQIFEVSPTTVYLKKNESARRVALRAAPCRNWDR